MKVIHLLSTNSFSGAENVVCQIINMYKSDNVEMFYCSPSGQIEKTLQKKKIKFLKISKLSFFELKRIIKTYKPDIIHAHDIKASILASFFSKNCKIISHIHGNSKMMKQFSPKSLLYLIASKRINHIFWVSNSSLKEYKYSKSVESKSTVLENVIDIKEIERKSKEKEFEVSDAIFVGRITQIKNPIRLVKIFKKVCESLPNAKLVIVGDGELKDEIKSFIDENQLSSNIKLVGFQSNPYKYMKNSKMLLLTSFFEGLPMCALEALTLGLPIVSTPTDGLVDLIKQNKNGFYSDNDELLVKKIVEILSNDSLLSKMSSYSKKCSEQINNIDKYKKELNKYYLQ